jgi:hypothetical protein
MAYTRYTINPTQISSMMIGPINSSAHFLAEMNVGQRNHKEQNRYDKKNRILHRKFPPAPLQAATFDLEPPLFTPTLGALS